MHPVRFARWLTLVLVAGLTTASFNASPEDIDIFSVDEGTSLNPPNVLIVLDNTSNWSRQAQDWPGGEVQGQSEADAIRTVIGELNSNVNVGVMEYVTGGSAGDTNFGFVRSHIRPMNAANRAVVQNHMTTIYNNINSPTEKRGASNPYGDLFRDVYNYLAGANQANGGAGTPASADTAGYDINFSNFRTPLTANDSCTRTIVIFLGNNVNGTITADSSANVEALRALAGGGAAGDSAVAQINHAEYVVTTQAQTDALGYSGTCYSSAASCSTAENTAACRDNGYNSCVCDAADSVACPTAHWTVVGTDTSTTTSIVSDTGNVETAGQNTNESTVCARATEQPSAASCTLPPAGTPFVQQNTPAAGQTTTTNTSWKAGSCSWFFTNVKGACTGANRIWERHGTRVTRTTVTSSSTSTSTTNLGPTNACYNDAVTCNPADTSTGCPASLFSGGCACTAVANTSGCAAGNTQRYQVKGDYTITAAEQTGRYTTAPAGPLMMDEWARFMRQRGIAVPGLSTNNQVTTYTIDVFNKQQSPELSGLWFNAARVGGGKYFQAKDKAAIVRALREILTEVQAVNSAFSSASLPINATNRSQNENQIFIGVFKPDRTKDPLWFGNLKRFQAVRNGAEVTLGDRDGNFAINNQTGFLSECATSFWSTDSGNYWERVITDDPEALGICSTNSTSDYSDAPDGPFVEKGAAAEVVRKGNNPATAADGNGNYPLNRSVKTLSGGALVPLTAAVFDDGDAATDETAEGVIVEFIKGADVDNDDLDVSTTEPRSTIHGDVVHSRPQPVNYGGSTGVVVFYGANDGLFRAVKASNGQELWAFLAPEHQAKTPRLRRSGQSGTSLVKYFGSTVPGATPKDYFFDGSTGLFQSFNASDTSTKALIFPTQRRGGRKIYAFDVTDPASPAYLWSKGCPNLTNDTGCDTGFSAIGQTWSLGSVAFLEGYSTTRPVVIMGGGYDRCDDEDIRFPCVAASKGRGVYVIDAQDGTLVKFFDFSTLSGFGARGVAADVALISMNPDKFVDFAYAVDTGGNVYRMDFTDGYGTLAGAAPTDWAFNRVAFTNDAGRKFLFPPALLQNGDRTVYLAIGTGDREHPLMANYPFGTEGDPSSAVVNRFYVFKDNVSDTDASTALNLDSIDPPHNMKNYTTDPGCAGEKVTTGSEKNGWFMDLTANGQGEQVVTSAVIATGAVNFSTNRPTPPATAACSSSLGEARGYEVNLLNRSGGLGAAGNCGGVSSSIFVGGGLPPSPVIATIRIGDRVDTIVIGAPDPDGGAGSFLDTTQRNPILDSKRRPVYWYKSTGEQ